MQTDISILLIGVGVELIFFLLKKTIKKIPRWAIVIGWAVGGLFIILGILGLLGINWIHGLSVIWGIHIDLGVWIWIIPLILLIILLIIARQFIMNGISRTLGKITRLRITIKPQEEDKNEPIAYILPLDPAEAISHLLISGRDTTSLQIYRGIAGCPIEYPIKL